jgi:polyhydroxyalkanoate synthesis regulator phasin
MRDRPRFGTVLSQYLLQFAAQSKTPIPEKASSSISYDLTVILGQFYTNTDEKETLDLLSQNYKTVQQYFNTRIRFDQTIIDLADKLVKEPEMYLEAKQKVNDFIKDEELPVEIKTTISESLASLERKRDPRHSRKTRNRVVELENEIKVLEKLVKQIEPKAP